MADAKWRNARGTPIARPDQWILTLRPAKSSEWIIPQGLSLTLMHRITLPSSETGQQMRTENTSAYPLELKGSAAQTPPLSWLVNKGLAHKTRGCQSDALVQYMADGFGRSTTPRAQLLNLPANSYPPKSSRAADELSTSDLS